MVKVKPLIRQDTCKFVPSLKLQSFQIPPQCQSFVVSCYTVRISRPADANILLEESANLYIGQSLDLLWKYHVHCPSEEDYLEMVDGSKTF